MHRDALVGATYPVCLGFNLFEDLLEITVALAGLVRKLTVCLRVIEEVEHQRPTRHDVGAAW